MIDKKWINQAKKENRLPVNRLARKFLKENGQGVSDHNLWALEFLLWAQESNLVNLSNPLDQKLGELCSHRPDQVSKYLELSQVPTDSPDPEDLAWLLVNQLDLAMSESVQGYPPLPPGSYR